MKILYHHRIASKDGQFVHVEELTNAFIDQGNELKFVAPSLNENSDFGHDGGFVTKLKKQLPLALSYSFWIFIKLVIAIKQFKPEFIYERYNLYQPAGIWASKLFNIPLILEVNAPLVEERSRYSGLSLVKFAKWIENYTWKNATHTLPVTNVLADHLRNAGVKENNITVIHNGVNQSFIDEMLAKPINNNKKEIVIGFTGFIHPWHGMDKAIDAIAKYKALPLKLICVGDGNILPELKAQANALEISDKIEFAGLVTRDKVLNYVEQFDIALQPDVTAYASPLKMFEYMAAGIPVIASNIALWEGIVSEVKCGICVDPYSKYDIANAIDFLAENLDEAKEMGERGRAAVLEKYNWDIEENKLVDLYTRLLS